MNFNERARTVLSQVVTLHYNTCEPVGSSLISKNRVVPFSPATIRNIMMRLEQRGYLLQPHTSAGRLPTDLGYRAYVDQIKLSENTLNEQEKKALRDEIQKAPTGPAALETIAEHIHRQTRLLTFQVPFRQSGIRLKHIHFERINANRLFVLWIARGGLTFQSVLEIEESDLSENLVEKAENYFNHVFVGKNLLEIQRQLSARYGAPNSDWDLLLGKSHRIANALTNEVSRFDNIAFHGLNSLLEMPEFQSVNQVKLVFQVLDKQTQIQRLLKQTVDEERKWIFFYIGAEIGEPDMHGFTVAVAKMENQQSTLGCVGVLGPKRMPYLRSLQLLSHAREELAAQVW